MSYIDLENELVILYTHKYTVCLSMQESYPNMQQSFSMTA